MPCDAACVKIIINGHFMAILAPKIGVHRGAADAIGRAALKLADAARTLGEMAATRGITASATDGTESCEQAKTLIQWIKSGEYPADADARMDAWTAELWRQINAIAAGKFPAET
jgi:ribose/xylose/arabinose/galactoside ABC-type transport system permease subunit